MKRNETGNETKQGRGTKPPSAFLDDSSQLNKRLHRKSENHFRILRGWKFGQVCDWCKRRPLIGLKKATVDPLGFFSHA